MNLEQFMNIEQTVLEARGISKRLKPSRKWQPMKRSTDKMTDGAAIWDNWLYTVTVRNCGLNPFSNHPSAPCGVQLGISCHDGEARHDWRDFQRIKNDIVGSDWEAVELYPAESRLLDPSNYYILWCFPSIPLGKFNGRVIAAPHNCIAPQRGWAKGDEPKDIRA